MMGLYMMVIFFIFLVLVVNYGVLFENLLWLYVVGGVVLFFSLCVVGKLVDCYGCCCMFVGVILLVFILVLVMMYLFDWFYIGMLLFFLFFMVIFFSCMVLM